MAWDSKGAHNSLDRGGFFATVVSLLSDAQCCALRSREDDVLENGMNPGRPAIHIVNTQFPSPLMDDANDSSGSTPPTLGFLPTEELAIFQRLAELVSCDAELTARLDIPSLANRAEARSLRVRFLQMCMRGLYGPCHEIWFRLSEFERRDFMKVFLYGPPSRDYFLNIMVRDDWAGSDCGSSDTLEVRSDCT